MTCCRRDLANWEGVRGGSPTPRLALLLLALSLPLAACGDSAEYQDAPDATPELADPDPDGPLDVDPLSRSDGQTDDDTFDEPAETGDDLFESPVIDETPSE